MKSKIRKIGSLLILVSFFVTSIITGFSIEPVNNEIYSLTRQGITNNYNAYQDDKAYDSGWGNFSAFDFYVLKKTGIDLASWERNETNIIDEAKSSISTAIANPGGLSAKRLAQEHLAAKEIEESANANELLTILEARKVANENGDGSFDSNIFSDLPALEALGRAGSLGTFATGDTLTFVLENQTEDGYWGSAWGADFVSTAQGIRTLHYFKNYVSGEQLTIINLAIQEGLDWVKTQQNSDGSFPNSADFPWDDSVVDTSEVILTLKLLGIDPESDDWKTSGKSGVDYLLNDAKNEDNTFGPNKNIPANTSVIDAFLKLGIQIDTKLSKVSSRASLARSNNEKFYQDDKAFDSGWGNFSAFDFYVLKKTGIDLASWERNGTNIIDEAKSSISIAIANPGGLSAKRLAQEHLTAKEIGESANANELLAILEARKAANEIGDGSFDSNVFSDLPALEALGRAGSLGTFATGDTLTFVLENQTEDGYWGSAWGADFISTTQGIRTLHYFKNYVSGEQLTTINTAIQEGLNWVKTQQNSDGSFPNSADFPWDDPVVDTSEVIVTLKLLGIDPESHDWKTSGKSGVDYLLNDAKNEDNTFGPNKNIPANTSVIDAMLKIGAYSTQSLYVQGLYPVTINSNGNTPGQGGNPEAQSISITISVTGKTGSLYSGTVNLAQNDTHGQNPVGALAKTGLSYQYDSTDYIHTISGQGPEGLNGWMYKVNGVSPVVSAINYSLSDGDVVEWFYSTDPGNIAGVGGINTLQQQQEKSEKAEKDLIQAVEQGNKPVLSLKDLAVNNVSISKETIRDLLEKGKELSLESEKAKLNLDLNKILSKEIKEEIAKGNGSVAFGIKELGTSDSKKILGQVKENNSAVFDIGLGVFQFEISLKTTFGDGSESSEKITSFEAPVPVVIDLSSVSLTKEDIDKLSAVRYVERENGEIVIEKLGGVFDPENKTFTFYTEKFSNYGIIKDENQKKIVMWIDGTKYHVNSTEKAIDTAPVIIDNRTMVPLRAVGEALGAEVEWISAEQKVTVELDSTKLELIIGKTSPDLDVPAMIINSRTLVPLRYVSEKLGSLVEWSAENKSIKIIR